MANNVTCVADAKFGWPYTGERDGTESAQKCADKLSQKTGDHYSISCEDWYSSGADGSAIYSYTYCTIFKQPPKGKNTDGD